LAAMPPSRQHPRAAVALVAAVLALGLAAGCGDGGSGKMVQQSTATSGTPEAPAEEQPLSPAEEHGRQVFIETCGSCHTLDAAGTTGQIGPDLGDIPLDQADVRRAIEIGGTGSGTMPRNLVSGVDAADVAAFVAASGPGASGP
jgi:mono/diheme cytochrome c family protein